MHTHTPILDFATSQKDFLAREHFWYLGDHADVRRHACGRLFIELIFPARGVRSPSLRRRVANLTLVQPSEVGLQVSTRAAEGIATYQGKFPTNTPPVEAYLHAYPPKHQIWDEINQAVIQIEGMVNLAQDYGTTESLLTPEARCALDSFSVILSSLPSA